ncbi:UNVERIFIED_CONTAM: hypothetical protein K2H54_058458 [Gekko kuhli]
MSKNFHPRKSKHIRTGPDDSLPEDEDTMVVDPMEDKTMTDPEVPGPPEPLGLSGDLCPAVATRPEAQEGQEQEPAP